MRPPSSSTSSDADEKRHALILDTIRVHSLAMHIDSWGRGVDVAFLHGLPQDPEDLRPLADALADACRVHNVHLPGYGSSSPAKIPYDLDAVEAQLATDLRRACTEPPWIVGMSGGSYRMFSLAVSKRMELRGLFGVAPLAGLEDDNREAMRGFGQALGAGVDLTEAWIARAYSPAYAAAHPAECAKMVEQSAAAAPLDMMVSEFDAVADSTHLGPQLGTIEVPVHLRVGELDQATPPDYARAIAQQIEGTALEVVPGRGHMIHHEDFNGTVAALRGAILGAGR